MPRDDGLRREPGADLAELARAGAPDLRQLWAARRGGPPPPKLSARLLRHALAWDNQAGKTGGEPAAVRRQWQAVMTRRAEGAGADAAVSRLRVPPAGTGTRLLKSWGGETHEVIVGDAGFTWNGRTYASLSAVARAMTGTPRNGPRFFGLRANTP